MLKIRVIPTLLWKNVGLVKGVAFDSWRRVGTVLPAIKVYNLREVDELILLDISATPEGRGPDVESIEEFSQECFVPLTVGGGVRDIEQIRRLLKAGADKVAINTAAYENPSLIRDASSRYGAQCIVAAIDVRKTGSDYECFSHCGTRPAGIGAEARAKELESLGAGEILLTSIERDGTMQGYDLELVRRISEAVRVPVIASGGAGTFEHMHQAVTQAKASAVAAASMFHFTEKTPLEAKQYLGAKGLPVRRGTSAAE
jgi:cyclase